MVLIIPSITLYTGNNPTIGHTFQTLYPHLGIETAYPSSPQSAVIADTGVADIHV
jgi:hypothetical protein